MNIEKFFKNQSHEMYFDLADNDVYISFKKHLDYNPGFQQKIHKQVKIAGIKKNIRVDISSPSSPEALNKAHINRIFRHFEI